MQKILSFKTVFISDIHVSRLGIREKILLNKIKKISPDIIFITGDLVSWNGDYEKAFEFISILKAKVGIWAVLGDSDYQNSRKACIFCHSSRFKRKPFAVKFLRNQTVFLPVGQSRIAISGLELNEKDPAGYEPILRDQKGYPEILLSHNQFDLGWAGGRGERRKEAGRRGGREKIEDGKLRRWEDQKGHKAQGAGCRALGKMGSGSVLVLSGDTHGGQIYMPAFLWRKVFGDGKGQVRSGMIADGARSLFVTNGVGTNFAPLRFLCPPEIVLFVTD